MSCQIETLLYYVQWRFSHTVSHTTFWYELISAMLTVLTIFELLVVPVLYMRCHLTSECYLIFT